MISGLSEERVFENTEPAPPTSMGSPAYIFLVTYSMKLVVALWVYSTYLSPRTMTLEIRRVIEVSNVCISIR